MNNASPSDQQIFEHGRNTGRNPNGWAGMCPFMQPAQAPQKAVWLQGFSAGRIEANLFQIRPTTARSEISDLGKKDEKG